MAAVAVKAADAAASPTGTICGFGTFQLEVVFGKTQKHLRRRTGRA